MLNPVCILCEYPHSVLDAVTPDWLKQHGIPEDVLNRFLEAHHLDGRRHDPELVVPLCRNCHCEVTEGLLQAGVSMKAQSDPIIRVAVGLEAEAVFLEMLAKGHRRKAELLRNSRTWGLKNE
jgi:hypothetical protein